MSASKNSLFMSAMDYLMREKKVKSQKDFADIIGLSAQSISYIKNGYNQVSDDTLRKMNEAFGYIFNMAYFRGEPVPMLVKPGNETLPAWADSLIRLVSDNIAITEQLRRENIQLRKSVELLTQMLNNIYPRMYNHEEYEGNLPMAAES